MIQYNDMKVMLTAGVPECAQEWRNDFAVWKWCRQFTLIDEESQERWLDRISSDSTIKMFTIVADCHGTWGLRSVGVCGLTSIDHVNQKAEFSLYIAPEYRGRGYAHDALLTLLKHGFDDFNLNRIWGETYQDNPARNIFDRVGMVAEGWLRDSYFRNGQFIRSVIYSMLRKDFYARHRNRLGDCLERGGHGGESHRAGEQHHASGDNQAGKELWDRRLDELKRIDPPNAWKQPKYRLGIPQTKNNPSGRQDSSGARTTEAVRPIYGKSREAREV
jgi:RimJ/RimL family protein N-acetyltransferase